MAGNHIFGTCKICGEQSSDGLICCLPKGHTEHYHKDERGSSWPRIVSDHDRTLAANQDILEALHKIIELLEKLYAKH